MEPIKHGNRELAKYLGCSLRTASRLAQAMKKAGVVREVLRGSPPREVNEWFPQDVREYLRQEGMKKFLGKSSDGSA